MIVLYLIIGFLFFLVMREKMKLSDEEHLDLLQDVKNSNKQSNSGAGTTDRTHIYISSEEYMADNPDGSSRSYHVNTRRNF